MPTVKVVDLISRHQTITVDTNKTRWPALELQNWLNDAYREISLVRPDVNTTSGTFNCAAGVRQVLSGQFPNATTLVDVVRNMASGSRLRAITKIGRRVLDEQIPDWYAKTGVQDIEHFIYDPVLPKEFMVYPPAASGAQVEIVVASVPTAHTLTETQLNNAATTETIRIDDSYANAILDYMLYRAFTKDTDYAGNAQRASLHYQAMQNAIGAKSVADSSTASRR